jgi:hypothetical protein
MKSGLFDQQTHLILLSYHYQIVRHINKISLSNMQAPLSNNGQLPKDLKVLQVCKMLRAVPVKLTPKQFMLHYLTSPSSDLAFFTRGAKGALYRKCHILT